MTRALDRMIAVMCLLLMASGIVGCPSEGAAEGPMDQPQAAPGDAPTDEPGAATRQQAVADANGPAAAPDEAPAGKEQPREPDEEMVRQDQQEPNEPAQLETHSQPQQPVAAVAEPNELELASQDPAIAEPNNTQPIEPPVTQSNDAPVVEPNEAVFVEPRESVPAAGTPEPGEPDQSGPPTEATASEPNGGLPRSAKLLQDKCDEIFKTYVNLRGLLDYKDLRRKRLDLKALLTEFETLDPNEYKHWPRDAQAAFWINAYNVQMLRIITYNYPIKASYILSIMWGPYSIQHIKGIWSEYKFRAMGEEFTLAEIERRIFDRGFDDPRIFLAISYGSRGGPRLRAEAYDARRLNDQLDEQVTQFLSTDRGFKIDRDAGVVYLSALFQPSWRATYFVGKFGTDKVFKDQNPETRAVLSFIINYISQEDAEFLKLEKYSVKYIKYDWTIDDSSLGY